MVPEVNREALHHFTSPVNTLVSLSRTPARRTLTERWHSQNINNGCHSRAEGTLLPEAEGACRQASYVEVITRMLEQV